MRKRVWARSGIQGITVDPGPTGAQVRELLDQFETRLGSDVIGSTVAGIRLSVAAVTGDPGIIAVRPLRMGIVVADVRQKQTANVPIPITDPDANWMFYREINTVPSNTAAVNVGWLGDSPGDEVVIRSKRKIEELGTGLFLCFETLATNVPITVSFQASVLLLLP